jgi:hypothetical protein
MAWVFDRYITDRSLYAIQDEARVVQPGLWAVKAQMPPWEWRRSKGDMQSSPRAARNTNAARKKATRAPPALIIETPLRPNVRCSSAWSSQFDPNQASRCPD